MSILAGLEKRSVIVLTKRIFLALAISIIGLSFGCADISSGEPDVGIVQQPGLTSEYRDDILEETSEAPLTPLHLLSRAPSVFLDIGELYSAISLSKFSEFFEAGFPDPQGNIAAFQGISELYVPSYMDGDFELVGVSVHYINIISLFYKNTASGESASLDWCRYLAEENATSGFFGRGASSEYIEEYNGVEYYISEWVKYDTQEPDGYIVAWAQHGQVFTAGLPVSFTLHDVLAFCDVQPVSAWELLGDTISVSIQGIQNVVIFCDDGSEVVAIDDVLYRSDGGIVAFGSNETDGMERIGYRWLINETSLRYQYVLEPGDYSFHALGVVGDPGLRVAHFEAGEISSSYDYSTEFSGQSFSQFYLQVTPEPLGTTFSLDVPTADY